MNKKSGRLVSDLGISDVVSFKKKTDYSDVPKDYWNADIFVTTSLSDGTPVSLLEAMASGLPSIATSVGGIPEWIEDKKSGLSIPPGSPRSVAESLLTLAKDPAFCARLGIAARKIIVEARRVEDPDGTGRERLSGTHRNI